MDQIPQRVINAVEMYMGELIMGKLCGELMLWGRCSGTYKLYLTHACFIPQDCKWIISINIIMCLLELNTIDTLWFN